MNYHVSDLIGDLKDHKLKTGPFHLDEFVSWLAMIFEHFGFHSLILFIFFKAFYLHISSWNLYLEKEIN